MSKQANTGYLISPIQRRVWHLAELGGSQWYRVQGAVRIEGELDRVRLCQVVETVVGRHEALRTTLQMLPGISIPVQVVGEERWKDFDNKDFENEEKQDRRASKTADGGSSGVSGGLKLALVRESDCCHWLRISAPSVLLDEISMNLVAQEIAERYLLGPDGSRASSSTEDDPLQYPDVSEWLNEAGQAEEAATGRRFWRDVVSGSSASLRSLQKEGSGTFGIESLNVNVKVETAAKILAGGTQGLWSVSVFLLSAWAFLLEKLRYQSELLVAVGVDGRSHETLATVVGPLTRYLPVAVEKNRTDRFVDLHAQAASVLNQATGWQECFLWEMLGEEKSQDAQTVYVPFAFDYLRMKELGTGEGVRFRLEESSGCVERFAMKLSCRQRGEGLQLHLHWDTGSCSREEMARVAQSLAVLLEQAAAGPEKRLCDLEVVSRDERERLLAEFNRTAQVYAGEKLIHEQFAEQVKRTPKAEAVRYEANSLTYEELEGRAEELAAYLQSRGVGAESLVGICLERSLEMVIALLGVLKAGGAYVPLDPGYPQARLEYMLRSSGVRLVVSMGGAEEKVQGVGGIELVSLGGKQGLGSVESRAVEERGGKVGSGNPAYVIYTSGSTGDPKGVVISHGAIRNHMAWMQREFPLSAADRVLQKTAFSFDASVWEFYAPLLAGGCLVMARPGGQQDGEYLVGCFEREEITVLQLVPTQLRMLLEEGLDRCVKLKRVYCGGEALEQELVNAFYRQLPGARLFNLYGPTEATIDATWAECHAEKQSGGTAQIGKGIANMRLYVLDEDGQLAPVGVAGELYIAGAGVARGYLNRPELTAERFFPDKYGVEAGARAYRTGDLVRWSANGTLEFLGRNDGQVKVRGHRIELGEIEARLRQHEGVKEAAVVAREERSGEKQLVAYYTTQRGLGREKDGEQGEGGMGVEQLRAHILGKLPEYMVPTAFVRLQAMPLTPNGKLDRKALPAPEGDAYALRRYEAPRGEVETAVAAIWAEALKLEQVGRQDNFFELGGHSLLAMQAMSRMRKTFGVELPLRVLFEAPTIEGLAERVEEEKRKVVGVELPGIDRVSRDQPLPLSFAQQRLWFLAQMTGASKAYHMSSAVRLKGALHVKSLRRALDRIVARHETLRTTFAFIEGEPVQQILSMHGSFFPLVEHDLSQRQDKEEELDRLVAEETGTSFNLETGPLVRGRLIRLGEEEHALLITMHHIVSDGWSTGVLYKELNALYGAYERGEEDSLPPLEVQYGDYSVWQRKWMEGEILQEQVEYWKGTLAGAPSVLELPRDHARGAEMDYRGGLSELELDEELSRKIKDLSRRHGVTLYMTLLAGWGAVMARLSGRQDVVIGTPVANRGRSEIEGLIGFFLNMLALRLDFTGSPTVGEMLTRVKKQALAAQEHQDIPFEQVVETIQPVRSMAHSPIVQVVFDWHNLPTQRLELAGLEVGRVSSRPHVVSKFDLTLVLREAKGKFIGGAEYASSLFERRTVERYLRYFRNQLEAMVADDSQRMDSLPLMGAEEREQVVVGWNTTAVNYRDEACMHELFERQVEKTPERVAVVYQGQEVSYRQLEERANRLGNYLRKLGVGPEVRVGICVGRSVEMVVGLLGILKSGGAYVPLDPTHPAERIRYMLEDAQASVVLTQEGLLEKVPGSGARVVCLDRQWEEIGAESGERPLGRAGAENLAYIYYTSGSTGRPKGVAMAHSGIVNYIHWGIEGYEAAGGKGAAVSSSIAVDLTLTNFLPLFVGQPMVLAAETLGIEGLVELIQGKPEWSLLKITPTHLTLLNPRLTAEEMQHCTRVLVIGADNLVAEPTLVWREQAPGVKLLNEYGPTETVVGCSIYRIEEGSPQHGSMPIGKPIANITMYVLDRQGEPLPVGVPGELYIGGIGVARGYWGRPDLTAEKFVPDMFAGVAGARFYRTGDLARFLEDGNLEFLGRVDHQVKIRGYRIEPEEVEAVLSGCAGVQKAMVVVREDVPGEKRLVGYVAAPGGGVQASDLRRYLKERLPEYMVPAAWVIMDELPVGSSGKIDPKLALPKPEADAYALEEYEAPRGEVEETLAEIWSELLGVERVGRNDNFFELGGHSLLAVRVIARARQRLMLEVEIRDLFVHPDLSDFASQVQGSATTKLPPITRVQRSGSLPLSLAQQRLWFLTQMEGTSQGYHVALGLRLKGKLDRKALRRALDGVMARHEALRTTFVAVDGEPVQWITPVEESGFHLLAKDLRGHADVQGELERFTAEEAAAAFNLETGPLIRGQLVRLGEEEHALLITTHHIVSDGSSTGVLFKELSALYGAYQRGEEDSLPPLEVQYGDYAVWQRTWMEGEILQEQGEYWKRTLAGAPAVLELPNDHTRPVKANHEGAWVKVVLDEELTGRLKELSRRQGTTLYMTVLAGWVTLLGRLSGQTDVVVGTHYANRGHVEIENLIGFFVNNLPVRVDVGGGATVRELLARVKEQALGAQRNSEIPFEQVVEIIAPVRSLSHNPIFQVMFAWQNESAAKLELSGLHTQSMQTGAKTEANFDLTLTLRIEREKIVGGLVYAAALFERATITRYLGYLLTLLEAMVAGDSQVVDRLPWLPESERHQLLYGWNATHWECPKDKCVQELFEEQVQRTPEAVALVYEDQKLTYGDLNRRANRLAYYLRGLGVGPDARVVICVERSLEMIEGVLGVLKAGGTFVPLDPAYPGERLQFMLEDSQPYLVLTQAHLRERMQDLGGMVLVVDLNHDEDWRDLPDRNPDYLAAALNANHLAYMIYTSGSTGKPKGVMVEHGAWSNLILHHVSNLLLKPGDRVLQFVSFGFDVWGEVALTALCGGASLYLLSSAVVAELESLLKTVGSYAITHLFLPSPILAKLSEQSESVSTGILTTGGDRLSSDTAKRWGRGRRLINEYGPTEATVCATLYEYRGDETNEPPIGRPIANARIYILDGNGGPAPIGVAGEMYIGGTGVARGYWQRAELTAERFLPDPFAQEGGGRMYRTGDLGRWLADGNIEFMGRNDHQVKIRGFRIELGEIEACLAEHVGVREAVVLAREDGPGEKRLVAYYTTAESEGGEEVGAEQLRSEIAKKLPEYMVPAAYVRLERMPLTANGKLDRQALPAPEGGAYAVREYEAPVGKVEETLAEIWSELLGVERVGRKDNFFDLGGHSLLAVRVMARTQQWLGVEVGITDLFTHPCLGDFAASVEGSVRTKLPPITRARRSGHLPLSLAQQRLWFLAQMEGASETYHMPLPMRLKGRLDREALRRALDRLVVRHEALRTTFMAVDGEPVQRITPVAESSFQLREQDLQGHSDVERELKRVVAGEATASFNLETGPLIRGQLVRVGEEENALLITMHHIVSDGWSMGVLLRELGSLYDAFLHGEEDPLQELEVQYADYAVWQRKWMERGILGEQADYWKQTLAGAPALLELPWDHARPAETNYGGGFVELVLDKDLTRSLKALSRGHGATLFMTLLAGWGAVLARLSGQQEVVIGTPVANRGRSEIEGLIGFFLNMLAIRMDFGGAPTAGELLERVKRQALAAQEHQDIPFEQVVEIVRPARSMSHSPVFQVMFAWQNALEARLELPGMEVKHLSSGGVMAKFDLELGLREAGEVIVGGVIYATSLFDRATVERYLGYFRAQLEAMVADEHQTYDRAPLLGTAERNRVLHEWNATAQEYPRNKCVHELFEEQAANRPEAVAAVYDQEQLSYGELNRRANRLAHRLRGLGVKGEERVAVCVEQGLEMVIGLLGVLKAGGVYVPLDPEYPAERLGFMLNDSAPVVLLTEGHLQKKLSGLKDGMAVVDMRDVVGTEREGWEGNSKAGAMGVGPEHLAYVIYTSGSTGAPKGVMVGHRELVARLTGVRESLGFGGEDTMPKVSSTAFDISLLELMLPLISGGQTQISDGRRIRDMEYVMEQAETATVFNAVASLMDAWRQWAGERAKGAGNRRLRMLLVGGEPVPQRLLDGLREQFPQAEVVETYGPTETALYSTSCRGWKEGKDGVLPPIGRPLANTRMYILDGEGQPVPVGVVGELYIGGAAVARGYMNRAELTAERFVCDPFVQERGARMYRTGDLGRWRGDGNIEFVGRNDQQVKIRGYRIELGEIEACLAEHVGVREAVVLAREDRPGEKRLVAYYTVRERDESEEIGAEQLRVAIARKLPEYMVPAAYVRLERMPLTANGKLDRQALPMPEGDAYAMREYEAPVGEVEEALAEIWSELLGVERVGRNDNFFELGGHSLLAVRVMARLRQRLGLEVDLRALYGAATLASLATQANPQGQILEVPPNRIPSVEQTPDQSWSDIEISI